MRAILKAEGVGKEYRLGEYERALSGSLRESLTRLVRSPLKVLRGDSEETVWALRDVGFSVLPGEVLGIIGRNGAGKSTLLKVLSRITEPTTGRIELYGRVGSLLEVGTGFHPELTGRENIFLNGAIIGMSRQEIERKFDEIVAFSELERFLDTPVKRYSSGMYMRLGFAVAAHLEPEILMVDEVLAVGDAQFQKKCLGKMGDVARLGRTVLFVSHNMAAVQSLCDRVLWLEQGSIIAEGSPEEVIGSYLKSAFSTELERVWPDVEAQGQGQAWIRRVALHPQGESLGGAITVRTALELELEFWNLEEGAHLDVRIDLYNEQNVLVLVSAPVTEPQWHGKPFSKGLYRSVCTLPGDLLNEGVHRIDLVLLKDQKHPVVRISDALTFEVRHAIERRGSWHTRWPGAVHPDLTWKTERIRDASGEQTGPTRSVHKYQG